MSRYFEKPQATSSTSLLHCKTGRIQNIWAKDVLSNQLIFPEKTAAGFFLLSAKYCVARSNLGQRYDVKHFFSNIHSLVQWNWLSMLAFSQICLQNLLLYVEERRVSYFVMF